MNKVIYNDKIFNKPGSGMVRSVLFVNEIQRSLNRLKWLKIFLKNSV